MSDQPVRWDGVVEPIQALHCREHAIGDTLGEDELNVLGTKILEVVIMHIDWFNAVGLVGANVKKEGKIKKMLMDLGICNQAPV